MATKEAGVKRKADSTSKRSRDGSIKKQKTGATGKTFVVAVRTKDADSSDEDDKGGASVHTHKESKTPLRDGRSEKPRSNGADGNRVLEPGQNSREAHAKQKKLAQERKAAKPLADELVRLKKLWEVLRVKSSTPKDERKAMVDELFSIITGRIKDFVLKHDAVRAVQTAIKYATVAQRKEIAKELQGSYAQLAEGRYAKFLIGKLIVLDDKETRDLIMPEFYGKVRRLINHAEASWILDDIYRAVASKEQKAILLREWYGPEFVLFKSGDGAAPTADLGAILTNEPSKRSTVMKYLFDMMNGLIQKKMTGFTMLHDAMLQYFRCLKPEGDEMKEFVEVIKGDENGDLLRNMAFTKSGARLVCLLLASGSAKDRRAILKVYKDTIQLMCGDDHGHMVILAAYDLIDDTVMTAKAIFSELVGKDGEHIRSLANNLNARTTVRYLFEGPSKALFPDSHAADLDMFEEIHKMRGSTSKKPSDVRRQELVAALSPYLLGVVAKSPDELVATAFGCHFVVGVLLEATGDKTAALQAIANTAAGDPDASVTEATYPPPPPHISLTPYGGKMFKPLIAGGRFDKEAGEIQRVDPPLNFADMFYSAIKDHVVAWATGPSAFNIVNLLESGEFSSADELKATLRASNKALRKAATEETREQRAIREAKAQVGTTRPKKKKKSQKQRNSVVLGNAGTRLLLATLYK